MTWSFDMTLAKFSGYPVKSTIAVIKSLLLSFVEKRNGSPDLLQIRVNSPRKHYRALSGLVTEFGPEDLDGHDNGAGERPAIPGITSPGKQGDGQEAGAGYHLHLIHRNNPVGFVMASTLADAIAGVTR